MADAADSKSADRKVVKVRLLSPAPSNVLIRQTVSFSELVPGNTFYSVIRLGSPRNRPVFGLSVGRKWRSHARKNISGDKICEGGRR